MSPIQLKALLLEDSKSDALLLVREMRRGGFEVEYERVETAVGLNAALENNTWDIILSDHSMPSFSASEALEIVRKQKKLDTPFIIVSGTISEDGAVAVMREGANDYFSKNKLTRLVPAIERELQEAEERRRRHLAEKQLQKTEERFAKAFNASPVAITITRLKDNIILLVNPGFTDLFGYAESEIIGKSGAELNLWDNSEQRQILVEYLHRSKTLENVDVILHHANGEPIYALLSAEVIELDDEPCILSFIQNVTELKQRTEMLQQYNERLEMLHRVDQAILNSVHPRVIAQSTLQQLKQIIPFYTASVIRFDYENNQAILLTLETEGKSDYQAGDSIPIVKSPILDQLQEKRPYIIHNTEAATGLLDIERRVAASGIRSYLAAPLIYGDTLLGTLNLLSDKPDVFSEEMVAIVLEIATHLAIAIQNADLYQQVQQHANKLEQHVAERTAELQYQKERIETILRNSEDAILLLEKDGSILQANYSFCKIFGWTKSEVVGKQFSDAARVAEIKLLEKAFQRMEEKRTPHQLELTVHNPSGVSFEVDALLSPVENGRGGGHEFVCSLRNIAVRKQIEEELRNALNKEKELNELKSSFTSMITHEFRTPLTIIKISTETLINFYDRLDGKKRVEKLHVIDQQINRLTKLMDDVLLLGRGEQSGLTFNPVDTDLISLVNDVIEEVEIGYQKGRTVNFVYDEACRHAFVDKHLFLHILQNLLTNAFKYSPVQSTITIHLECNEKAATLLVKDEGIGMPLEFQKNLFKMFHRAKNVEEDYQGTGLGLAIVKRAVDSHGGTIEVDSLENKGTTVTVTLPKSLS